MEECDEGPAAAARVSSGAAHADRLLAAGLVPLPTHRVPDRFEAPEALLNPVAAGIQCRGSTHGHTRGLRWR